MGAKTALLAFTDGDLRPAMRGAVQADPVEVLELVREFHPDYEVTPIGDGSLDDHCFPEDDVTYATVLAGAELFCDQRLVGLPSELPERLLRAGAGRRILMHAMHSMSDALTFAVWEDGELVRSLSVSPDSGVVENIGQPYEFELPYWAGEHPVETTFPGQGAYPLDFHPLVLGEEALRAFFGFNLEGWREPDDVDPVEVPLHGFRVADPTGREQAEREARMEELLRRMRPPRRYSMNPDGSLREIGDATAMP
ncbi:DUF6928 family protein [Paractinoplanes atraurantiacus]|uniref:Uncharacterized protein n=1 Tax=Paractinoplanes atraurantiacus TaxID=1036182 RepID=A0A285KCK1_9ACTN|nr:hypothetical protein [Actinoplanes atraurantiacus]SNY70330.1 hypothetical protein SAMN05421748_13763 [Actinoplanes atraurantiacus]